MEGSCVVVAMRHPRRFLAVAVGLIVVVMAVSTAFAGTRSSPDIDDDTGDWQANPDPGVVSGNVSNAVSDSIDIDGVWFDFTSKTNLQVGVTVVNLAAQDTNNQDTGSLTYTFEFTFHRPALPGAEASNVSGLTATISTNLNPAHVPACEGAGDNASKFPSEDYLICNIPSSEVAPDYEGNTTFYDGDQITAGSLDTEGQSEDGQVTYSDTASGMSSPATAQDVQPQPTGDGTGDDGGDGDGDGGGGGDDGGGNGESTPGVGILGAAAAMALVAVLAARRRD